MTAALEQAIADAIGKADAAFGYSFNLTRLVDGEETHTLNMDGFEPIDFQDREDGYALIARRRNALRSAAVIAVVAASAARARFEMQALWTSPAIEALTPTHDEWMRCKSVQDRYDLMKSCLDHAVSLVRGKSG